MNNHPRVEKLLFGKTVSNSSFIECRPTNNCFVNEPKMKDENELKMRVDDNFDPVVFKQQRDSASAIFTHISWI